MPLPPVRKRLVESAVQIADAAPEELTFQHSVLTQCALPTVRQPPEVLVWERKQGRATLIVEAGRALDLKTGRFVQMALPYGPKARLILMHLNTEAIRRQSPVIPVEDSMTAFFRRLMGRTQDGRQVRMLKAQLSALAAATIRMGLSSGETGVQVDTKIVGAFDLWWPEIGGQRVLWPATLRLSLDYYDSLSRHAVPLDERAIAALAHSAVALDIYCWLAQRLHRIPPGAPQFIPWSALHEQFGQGYAELRNFRPFFLRLLKQVKAVYPDAVLDADGKGVRLWQSPPPVSKRVVPLGASASRAISRQEGQTGVD